VIGVRGSVETRFVTQGMTESSATGTEQEPPSRRLRIALVAGEASGDALGGELVEALRRRYPQAQFAGVAGPRMREAGVEAWYDSHELAVMGLIEVLRHLPRLLWLRRRLRQRLLAWQPDVFVGIDAPDFNLGLERQLKRAGLRTVHYVSPAIWAWRPGRAATIGRSADRVLCLFPMEPPIYAEHGVDARFVGHPMADRIDMLPDRAAACRALGLDPNRPVLAVLPGSRASEIERLGAIFVDAVIRLQIDMPQLQVIAPMADQRCRDRFAALGATGCLQLLAGRAQECMIAADVVLLASGTAALEAMLCKRPMVVAYRISPLTHRIVTALGLLQTRNISLPNILAGESLVPELLQQDCNAENIWYAVRHWFDQADACATVLPRFAELHMQLRQDASQQAAGAIAEMLEQEASDAH
jgi:lipid-A-disaccharide synthase